MSTVDSNRTLIYVSLCSYKYVEDIEYRRSDQNPQWVMWVERVQLVLTHFVPGPGPLSLGLISGSSVGRVIVFFVSIVTMVSTNDLTHLIKDKKKKNSIISCITKFKNVLYFANDIDRYADL